MKSYGRLIAASVACFIVLLISVPAYPSYDSEAGRKYSVACQRLFDLRKSSNKKKYRSYWIDCVRTFELVEKQYPKSPSAGDACFDRAQVYSELYQFNKYSRDLNESISTYDKCWSLYPGHARIPEALFRSIELTAGYKKDGALALKTYTRLAQAYPDSAWTERAKKLLGVGTAKAASGLHSKHHSPQAIATVGKKGQIGTVKSIRHWSEGAYTRIVIDQTKPVEYHVQELRNPDRLVFDILNSRADSKLSKNNIFINDGILKQVRAGQYTSDTVRVVLDLASIKSYAAFRLLDPHRLVIDVTGETGTSGNGQPLSAGTDSVKNGTAEKADEKKGHAVPGIHAAQPAELENEGSRLTLSRQMGLKIKTIAIDAGHGGQDPGAIGKSGLKEKQITLDIAKRLAVLVKQRLGCNVVMTRDRDVYIPLDQRPFIAKSQNADLFVSIHVNANRKKKTRGIETYVQGLKASDREAMATAARENAMSTRSLSELDSEVDKMLKDLKIDNKIEESIQLAGTVQGSLIDMMKPLQRGIVNHGVKSAFFYVLMNTNIPSILAEVGFISNAEEEQLLRKDSYRQKIAEALFEGVKKYMDARSPQIVGI